MAFLYRAVDQYGQVIDVMMSEQRDTAAARRFFARALRYGPAPVEVTTDKAGPYLRVIDELVPAAAHITEQYDNNPIESDHARLKARLRPMRGLKQLRSATRIAAGHAFVQNLRRGHYELAVDVASTLLVAGAFTELAHAMCPALPPHRHAARSRTMQQTPMICVEISVRLYAAAGSPASLRRGQLVRRRRAGRRGRASLFRAEQTLLEPRLAAVPGKTARHGRATPTFTVGSRKESGPAGHLPGH